ncbi:MAG: phosphoribosylformylglycinamidine cyclo-ligase [Christensenellaceae bacterium]|jgi:phosphoribosylformylglycinamidine cyclo-ligase|nr:phosphoribosylformylglycinamidine cyclo-ligase [Christensenellaceae bacterium]
MAISYKDAGVDVTAGYKAVDLIKNSVRSTFDQNVLGDIGSFGGFYSIENFDLKKPVLVSGTDGVGTKLKYAFSLNKFDTVGIDCVAMCVNDIVCLGAKPLFFLDYIATGKLLPESVASIVSGIANGCKEAGCSLIGGETAEMPGFYKTNEFDLAGFTTGIVDRDKIISGSSIRPGDILVGFASSGAHSNGYSLIRQLFNPDDLELLNSYSDELDKTIGEALLTPTRIYVKTVLDIISKFEVLGLAHITGGGFIENIPRMIPAGYGVSIDRASYDVPNLFKLIVSKAGISTEQAYNTFNMGIGLVACVKESIASDFISYANSIGEQAYCIGHVTATSEVRL